MAESVLTLNEVHTHIGRHHILQGGQLRRPAGAGPRGAAGPVTAPASPPPCGPSWGSNRPPPAVSPWTGRRSRRSSLSKSPAEAWGFVPEDQAVLYNLTVAENFRLAMLDENQKSWARMETIFHLFPDLKKFWNLKAGVLSGGQKQMLAIGRAFVNDHQLLLIDEPSKGLAPIVVRHLGESLNLIKDAHHRHPGGTELLPGRHGGCGTISSWTTAGWSMGDGWPTWWRIAN